MRKTRYFWQFRIRTVVKLSNLTFERARSRSNTKKSLCTHSESAPVLIFLRNEILSPWRERSMIYQRADISCNRLTSFRQAAFLEQKGGHRSRFHGISPDRCPRLILFELQRHLASRLLRFPRPLNATLYHDSKFRTRTTIPPYFFDTVNSRSKKYLVFFEGSPFSSSPPF